MTGKGNHLCNNPAVPMDKLDHVVLNTLADKVFNRSSPSHVGQIQETAQSRTGE